MQEAEAGLTNMAMGDGRFAADNHLIVRFYMDARLNRTKTAEEGRQIWEDTTYIEIMQPGNKESIVRRPATEMDKRRFASKFRDFEAMNNQEAVTGTLLEEWPAVTRAQVEELRYFNIRTVEQLRDLSDSNAQNIMGVQMLKQKAKHFLEAADQGKVEDMAKRIAELEALVNAKPKGRPKKEDIPLDAPED